MKTLLLAAALLTPALAKAQQAARQFDLHCAGKTDSGKPAKHWLSIDTGADRWCLRDAAHGACQLQPFSGDEDGLSATADDPEAKRNYSLTLDRGTGEYSYLWDFDPHPSADGRDPKVSVEEHGSCTAQPFTPYQGAPLRPHAGAPTPAGKRF
ncbi:hypothetical protein [Sphingomonas sp. KR3-1]|uniref:hypothetical protein n=1 Tax=Sphingomonas sp. KR3-1 TaxID=3156611 RepID=UPI0032B49D10